MISPTSCVSSPITVPQHNIIGYYRACRSILCDMTTWTQQSNDFIARALAEKLNIKNYPQGDPNRRTEL